MWGRDNSKRLKHFGGSPFEDYETVKGGLGSLTVKTRNQRLFEQQHLIWGSWSYQPLLHSTSPRVIFIWRLYNILGGKMGMELTDRILGLALPFTDVDKSPYFLNFNSLVYKIQKIIHAQPVSPGSGKD